MDIIDLRKIKPPDEIGAFKRGILFPVLAPLSGVYALASRLWRSTPPKVTDPGVPVISIGSISVGGTGKTPLCMHVARRFAARGTRVCVLSRGYRRRSKRSPLAVSDGDRLLATVEEAGDEPYMMARRLPGVAVMVGKNRIEGALAANDMFAPALLVLDDGFQYRRIAKSAEIVCLDLASLKSGAAVLPLGSLREGLSSVKADHIVVVFLRHGDRVPSPGDIKRLRSRNVFYAARSKPCFVDGNGKAIDTGVPATDRVAIVSGLARPAGFEKSCLAAGVNAAVSIRFEDHHWYQEEDIDKIKSVMNAGRCNRIVTTEKDIYKMPAELKEMAIVARTDTEIEEADRFWNLLDDRVRVDR
jgi:tetraacyldisaccharide 4'-kinase